MVEINQICFLRDVLRGTKNFIQDNNQMTRLYNDACIALVEIVGGYDKDNTIRFDDGEVYLLTDFALNILKKKNYAEHVSENVKQEIKRETKPNVAPKVKPETMPEEIEIEPAVETVVETAQKNIAELQPSEQQMIMSKHVVRLSNKKNPSDVKEFSFLVKPLLVTDNVATADITVTAEHNGQKIHLVSSKDGQKSIQCEIGGMSFMIRGTWKNRRFNSMIYPAHASEYDMKDNESSIAPEHILAETFDDSFVQIIGDAKLYVLPNSKMNEPDGFCSISIVQEENDERLVHANDNNVHFLYIGGIKFRVYAKWTAQKAFLICTEQMDA